MNFQQENDRLVIKVGQSSMPLWIWLGTFSAISFMMVIIGLLLGSFSQPRTLGEAFKWFLIFGVIAFLLVLSGAKLLWSIGYQIVIDSEGVREERKFFKKRCRVLRWKEITDWGCTYSPAHYGRYNYKAHYWFYFSDIVLPEDLLSKKVDKKCIWIDVLGEKELGEIYPAIMSFCKQKTKILPYRSVAVKKHMGEYITKRK